MVDPDEAIKAAQKIHDNLDPKLVQTATEQGKRVKELVESLEAKGITPEQISELTKQALDRRDAEQGPIVPIEPSLADLSAKLDEVLDRLSKIEVRLDV